MNERVKDIIRIIVLFGLLLIPIWFALANAIDLQYSIIKKFAYLSVVILLLIIPLLFLKTRVYFLVEGVFNFLFFPIDIVSLYLNRQSTSTAFLHNIFATNLSESKEIIVAAWPLAIVVIVLWVVYFVLAVRVQNCYLFSRKTKYLIAGSFITVCVVGVCVMALFISRLHNERKLSSTIGEAIELAWFKLYKIYPYNLYLESYDLLNARYQQNQLAKQVASFSFGIPTQSHDQAQLFILVIGETARYDHFGINGYARNTTPLLSHQQNLISYDSAFSQANLTSNAIPLLITRAEAQNPQQAYAEKTLPEAFQEAGYKAGWITKQLPFLFVQRAMEACDYSYFYSKGNDVGDNYDEEMVHQIREFTEDTAQFFVLHSLGCHFRYEQRYPADFAQFQPVFGEAFSYSKISEENKEQLVNAYDNAILYTDYFMNELISYVDSLDRPAVILFMSDHGESFWDDERKLSLHGSYQISEYEYHVPLFIWYSDEYEALYPNKVQVMKQNKTTPVSSDVVFYSLLDLAGVEGTVLDSSRSICSPYLHSYDTIQVITGSGSTEQMIVR